MAVDKAKLIEEVELVSAELTSLAAGISEKQENCQVYAGAWTAKQVFAHLASFNFVRILTALLERAADNPSDQQDAFDTDAWNERQVQRRSDKSMESLVAEIVKHHSALVDAVPALSQANLDTRTSTRTGMTGTAGGIIYAMLVKHDREHMADVRKAISYSESA